MNAAAQTDAAARMNAAVQMNAAVRTDAAMQMNAETGGGRGERQMNAKSGGGKENSREFYERSKKHREKDRFEPGPFQPAVNRRQIHKNFKKK